jgi:hypothetical protein
MSVQSSLRVVVVVPDLADYITLTLEREYLQERVKTMPAGSFYG